MTFTVIDVREKDEFLSDHIDGSLNIPLSEFSKMAPGILNVLTDRDVLLMCRSGNRAQLALQEINQLGYADKIRPTVFQGGILQWKKENRPTVTVKSFYIPIMRQVQIAAGALGLSGVCLGYFINPAFYVISGFVGAGLMVAGVTGFCGMAKLLAVMPWNNKSTQSSASCAKTCCH